MPTPSLLIVPARFKTGKLYSQIPTSGAGDFTVTRNTEARRFDSAGLVASVASGIPRLDYYTSGGVTGCPALLVEPAATNLALQSEDFTAADWTFNGVTRTANQTTAPNGLTTADRISITSNSGYIRLLLATSGSTTYTASCFVKNDTITGSDLFRFYFNNNKSAPNSAVAGASININAGTVTTTSTGGGVSDVSAGIENYGNGWYRVRVTFTLGAAAGGASTEIGFDVTAATRTFFAWGAQLETGSVATSYIPTTTGTESRSADVISVSGAVSGSIGQTEGTIYVEVDVRNLAIETYIIRIDEGASSNIISLRKLNTNQIRTAIVAPTTSGTLNISSAAFTAGIIKIAFAYKSGEIALSVNGATALTTNGTFVFGASLNRITLGSNASASSEFNDRIRAVALYTTRLTNAELATLTTP